MEEKEEREAQSFHFWLIEQGQTSVQQEEEEVEDTKQEANIS